MRAAFVALLLLPMLAHADNIRGVCVGGGVTGTGPITAAERCLVNAPGEYAGGDTVYLKSFGSGMFTQTIPPGQLVWAPDGITPYALYETAKTQVDCTHLVSLSSASDSYISAIRFPSHLTKAWCISTGTVTTAPTINISECASDGTGCVANTTSVLTCDADGDSTTAFAGAGTQYLDADDWMQADITNTPTVVAGITTVCFSSVPE